jgi:hypothetical protein
MRVPTLPLLLLLALVAGCRTKPDLAADADVVAARAAATPEASPHALAVSTVEVAYAPTADLDQDASRYPARIDADALSRSLLAAVALSPAFPTPTAVPGPLDGAIGAAHGFGCDILLRPVLKRLDCVYTGHNLLWIPNIGMWLFAWVPSFWVPDEDFAIEGDLDLELYAVPSERLLLRKSHRIRVEGMLDDFERGWSFTGIVTVPFTLDAGDWARVSETLRPKVEHEIEKAAALECASSVPAYLRGPDFAAKDPTVYALAIGLSRHAGDFAGPPGAAEDARRFATVLAARASVPGKNVRALVDHRATVAGVEDAIRTHLGRTRPCDAAILYWSGLGATDRARDGPGAERYLLPFDGDPRAVRQTALPLERLRAVLSEIPARRIVVVLDASFGGGRPASRSLPPAEGLTAAATDEALVAFSGSVRDGKRVTLIVASGPGEDAIDLDGAGGGLFTFALLNGAEGGADEDRDGVVSSGELQAVLERDVRAEAGLEGVRQGPLVFRGGRRASPRDPDGRVPWPEGAPTP